MNQIYFFSKIFYCSQFNYKSMSKQSRRFKRTKISRQIPSKIFAQRKMKIMTFQRLPKISEDMLDKATYLGKATTLIWPRQIKGFSPFVSRQNSRVAMRHNNLFSQKKIYDIYKFQIFKKITIFHNILNIRRLCLDCIRHFQRAISLGYIILQLLQDGQETRQVASQLFPITQLAASFTLILGCQGNKHLIIFNLIQHFTERISGNLICSKVGIY